MSSSMHAARRLFDAFCIPPVVKEPIEMACVTFIEILSTASVLYEYA